MAFSFFLSSNHDIMINKNRSIQIVYGAQEVRQRIIVTLQHYWQEYFLNVPSGVPWYEVLLGSKDLKVVSMILRKTVLDVVGVISIVSFDVRYSTTNSRQVVVSAVVEVLGTSGPDYITIENEAFGIGG